MRSQVSRALAIALGGAVLLASSSGAPLSAQAEPAGGLTFFKNYFITGDYIAAGVGLRGKGLDGIATGTIGIEGIPADADITAAFLYWQVVTKDTIGPASGAAGVTFNGFALSTPDGPIGKVLDQAGTSPCWSSGGGTGNASGVHKTYTYRADVLRFFDLDDSGKPKVNGAHTVGVPDAGSTGNGVPIALGATLVVVYRHSSLPLSAIVLFDDGFTVDNANRTMQQAITGFYQPSQTPDAKVTYIVGSGQSNKNEIVTFNGTPLPASPFSSSDGDSWDTRTYAVGLGETPTAISAVTTTISTEGVNGSDCLTPAAIVFKTNVLDTDADGLLDVWEEATTALLDPNGRPLPLLGAMGADKNRKDVFVQVDSMYAGEATTYGGVAKPAHSHRPSHETIKLIGDALWNAPERIALHVDLGPDYPVGDGSVERYVLNRAYARGGRQIDEMRTVCDRGDLPPWACQFADFPGTVGWKTGFRYIRDEIVSGVPAPESGDDPCDVAGNDGPGEPCERRFDRNRHDIFHYALFAHAVGIPKSGFPCLVQQEVDGQLVEVPGSDVNGYCAYKENPDFRVPRTITGVGDFPGGDVLVTLGAFSDVNNLPVGTPFMQASTLLHELGHNGERRHGGDAGELNCKPTYLSVMNYLYQLRGLLDDRGVPNLDFSRQAFDISLGVPVDETALSDNVLGATLPYRIGWYAPLEGSYLDGRPGVQAARSHCDGTPLAPGDVPMVRFDARTAAGAIDWNANGTADGTYGLDVNFNGRTRLLADGGPELLPGVEDWSKLKLNQIGSRRNIGGVYFDRLGRIAMGALSTGLGRGDWGRGDWGRGDWGRGDWGRGDWGTGDLGLGDTGRGDWGRGDWGRGDWGRGDWGRGDWGRGDWGRGDWGLGDLGVGDTGRGDWGRGDWGRGDWGGGDLSRNDPNVPFGELDFETAQDLAKSPPNEFQACVIGVDCPAESAPLHRVKLSWKAPNVGEVVTYNVYRVAGGTLLNDPNQLWTLVGSVPAVVGQESYSAIDATELVNAGLYTYFAVAVYADGVASDHSNLVTITARNDPPAATHDSYTTAEDTPLVQPAPGVLVNDDDPDSDSTLAAVLVSGPSHGTLVLNADGSFTYSPSANYYGTDAFTYRASDGAVESNVATVDITVTPVNDVPSGVGDSYQTTEDTPLVVAAPGVLANDTDPDSALAALLVSGPANGALTLNPDGSFTYTPAPNFNGTDGFTYRASDGDANSDPASVSIAVHAVNDVPVAAADAYSVLQGGVLTVTAPGVLGNDSDVEGPLSAVLQSGPANGTLTLQADGGFVYTPSPTFFGTDSFSYAASDGQASSVATVSVTVRKLQYGFAGVQNLPPPSGKQFNVGSSVPLRWQFTVDGVVYDSTNASPQLVIVAPSGAVIYSGTPADPGSSSFQPPTAANGYTWQFNWQTKNLASGTYRVFVGSLQTGQVFAAGTAFGPFPVSLK